MKPTSRPIYLIASNFTYLFILTHLTFPNHDNEHSCVLYPLLSALYHLPHPVHFVSDPRVPILERKRLAPSDTNKVCETSHATSCGESYSLSQGARGLLRNTGSENRLELSPDYATLQSLGQHEQITP